MKAKLIDTILELTAENEADNAWMEEIAESPVDRYPVMQRYSSAMSLGGLARCELWGPKAYEDYRKRQDG